MTSSALSQVRLLFTFNLYCTVRFVQGCLFLRENLIKVSECLTKNINIMLNITKCTVLTHTRGIFDYTLYGVDLVHSNDVRNLEEIFNQDHNKEVVFSCYQALGFTNAS